jgi:hypothetical protein
MDLSIAEVTGFQQAARFFKEENADFVEVSFVGSKDSLIKKVTPEHMAKFKDAWDAYCDGRELEQRKGTPLTDAPMIDTVAKSYVQRNVHTLEELAMLSDAQCQALGHGTLTYREAARKLLSARLETQKQDQMNAVSKASATLGKEAVATVETKEIMSAIGELSAATQQTNESLAMLIQLMTAQATKGKPGRKPKVQE